MSEVEVVLDAESSTYESLENKAASHTSWNWCSPGILIATLWAKAGVVRPFNILSYRSPGSVISIDRTDGHLTLLNTVRSGGAGPAYVGIHPLERFMLVANYFGGSVAVPPILPDVRLGNATDIKNDAGKIGLTQATSAPPGRFAFSGHDRTHAHMIQSDPSGRFVLHVDLGLDQIVV